MSYPASQVMFNGNIDLSNPAGTLYNNYTQGAALGINAINPVPGGWATVVIIANGGVINIPSTWILYGGDEISTDAGAENHLQVFYKDPSTIYYSNKVVAP